MNQACLFSHLVGCQAKRLLCILKAALCRKPSGIHGQVGAKQKHDFARSPTVSTTPSSYTTAFYEVSQNQEFDLEAASSIAEQRITLRLENSSIAHLMHRLSQLLSHTAKPPLGCHWEEVKRIGTSRKCWRLWRDKHSEEQEQELLDYPRRKAARLLREFRTVASLTPEQATHYRTDLPSDYITDPDFQPFRTAIKGMTDAQIELLINGNSVPIAPNLLTTQIAAYNVRWRESTLRQRENALASKQPDPYPNGVPNTPPDPPALRFERDDYEQEHPERFALYGLFLDGISVVQGGQMHVVFNPLEDDDTPYSETPETKEPIVDLTPILGKKTLSDQERGDIGFTLQALAKTANISVYQEHFYKTAYWGARSSGLKILKGTVPELIRALCKEWGYHAEKVGSDYFFWSKTWAQDRAFDIAEPLIMKWKKRYLVQQGFTLRDRIEMASRLTWAQLRLTLNLQLPESGQWELRRHALALRFLGQLSPNELSRTMATEGIMLSSLSVSTQQQFFADLMDATTRRNMLSGNAVLLHIEKQHFSNDATEERYFLTAQFAASQPFLRLPLHTQRLNVRNAGKQVGK